METIQLFRTFDIYKVPATLLPELFRLSTRKLSNSVVAIIFTIFLRINLPNFVQFKQYQGKSGPRVESKIFHYCEYKQFKH